MLNPLLTKVKLPGRVFALPSKGLFYTPGEVLDVNVRGGEIQVKPMSALTEIKLRSADLLLSGKILREVCQECAPEIINPDKLLTKDVDALFIFLVISTYGSTKRIRSIHNCEKGVPHDYEISLDQIVSNPRNDSLVHKDMLYRVDLNNGQAVNMRPVQFLESVDIMTMRQEIYRKESNGTKVTTDELEAIMIADLLCVIDSVEDTNEKGEIIKVTDKNLIAEWARILTTKHIEMIVKASTEASDWGFDYHVPVKCKDCGEKYDHELELNPVNFFSG